MELRFKHAAILFSGWTICWEAGNNQLVFRCLPSATRKKLVGCQCRPQAVGEIRRPQRMLGRLHKRQAKSQNRILLRACFIVIEGNRERTLCVRPVVTMFF